MRNFLHWLYLICVMIPFTLTFLLITLVMAPFGLACCLIMKAFQVGWEFPETMCDWDSSINPDSPQNIMRREEDEEFERNNK